MVGKAETTQRYWGQGVGQENTAERTKTKEIEGTESVIWGLKGVQDMRETRRKQVIPKFVDGVTECSRTTSTEET